MGIFNKIKHLISENNKEINEVQELSFSEPKFIKRLDEDNKVIKELEELLKSAPEDKIDNIEKDLKLISYGIMGKRTVEYELENSHMPILILQDLYFQVNKLTSKIDAVVIDSNFIIVLECTNLIGDIVITDNGSFIRYFKNSSGKTYKKEGMYSPIVQNERHLELVKSILIKENIISKEKEYTLKNLVVFTNPKAIISTKYASEEIKEKIIRHDQLISKIKELHNLTNNEFSEECMYKISKTLMKYNTEKKVDYEKKYKLNKVEDNVKIKTIIEEDKIEETPLYKALKKYRYEKSKEENVKPYFLYNNTELKNIIKVKPKTIEELRNIKGFGNVKCSKYGKDIINIINNIEKEGY